MADKKKPGVMMYFKPMRESAEKLSDSQLAALIRALFAYADPDDRTEPRFEDDALQQIWPYVQSLVDRDDARYQRTSRGRQYSQFCRWFRRFEAGEPMSREDWEDAGCPSYKDWHTNVSSTDLYAIQMYTPDTNVSDTPDTNVYNADTPDTNVYNADTSDTNVSGVSALSNPPSNPNPLSLSNPASVSDTKDVYRRIKPPAKLLVPGLSPWLRAWVKYSEEHGKRMTDSTRDALVGEMNRMALKHGCEEVCALIDEAIESGWRVLRWEKLDRDPDAYTSRWLDKRLDERYAQD